MRSMVASIAGAAAIRAAARAARGWLSWFSDQKVSLAEYAAPAAMASAS